MHLTAQARLPTFSPTYFYFQTENCIYYFLYIIMPEKVEYAILSREFFKKWRVSVVHMFPVWAYYRVLSDPVSIASNTRLVRTIQSIILIGLRSLKDEVV